MTSVHRGRPRTESNLLGTGRRSAGPDTERSATRMAKTRDWEDMRTMSTRLLEERTGEGGEAWNRRIKKEAFKDEGSLRSWLTKQGVMGYAQTLLVMERFGYPDFLTATADELIDGQYMDRPQLRPILDAVIAAAAGLGDVTIQARKTFVALVSPRRTFARVQATTKDRVDLALRIDGMKPTGRLQPSRIHETMPVHISLRSQEDFDAEARRWLKRAYSENL